MRIVVALGGNALLSRGQAMTADIQRQNVKLAAQALSEIIKQHEVVITHGNGPQVGLLALQGIAYKPDELYPLDILDAETEGMIGYLIEQELNNVLPAQMQCATLLTEIEVDNNDPAFKNPTKPIGPVYNISDADRLSQQRSWKMARDGENYRRVVPSPQPIKILELGIIEMLVNQGVVVICAGGGGIPVVRRKDNSLVGVEAVIDKDSASALLAQDLKADVLLMLTDVDAVYSHWGEPGAKAIRCSSPSCLSQFDFAEGSMKPKISAANTYVARTGGIAYIGNMENAAAILRGESGTRIASDITETVWW